jgi:plastocyanin
MSDATIFYILAGVLAGLAVITSFIGIKVESFPGKAGPVVVLLFIALIGATTTFAVLNGQNEEKARAAENEEAGEEFEKEENTPSEDVQSGEQPSAEGGVQDKSEASGSGGTVQLTASKTDLAFDKKKLASAPGEITIKFSNPSAIPHDVAVEKDGENLGETELISESQTETTVDLEPGTYTFLCTVPGHAEAGMEGTLTVK